MNIPKRPVSDEAAWHVRDLEEYRYWMVEVGPAVAETGVQRLADDDSDI
ncbi:hypothetical protein [Parasphingopyxis sp.]|nr:hypothetical protein [Parasphingopyxis sp.]